MREIERQLTQIYSESFRDI